MDLNLKITRLGDLISGLFMVPQVVGLTVILNSLSHHHKSFKSGRGHFQTKSVAVHLC